MTPKPASSSSLIPAVLVLTALPILAVPPPADGVGARPTAATAPSTPAAVDSGIGSNADGTAQILVELSDDPAVEAYLRARSAPGDLVAHAQAVALAREQAARIEAAQNEAISSITSAQIGGEVLFSVHRLYNGIAVRAPAASMDRIVALRGVKAVHRLPQYRLDTAFAVPLTGAPHVWPVTGSNLTGKAVKIGIIDSGVDYLHRDFGGSGSYAGQAFDDTDWPHTAKVVGGYDFVGDAYDGTGRARPDGDPMDCGANGHGTHVAGIVAGYGVTAGGATYAGPYGPDIDFAGLAIGPGVAPEAELYALRIFGCSGTTGYVLAALDWAMDPNDDGDYADHLDVVNLSLGSPFGTRIDASTAAVDRAVRAGIVVVASAGNEGDTAFVTGSPASADRAISVAASDDAAAFTSAFAVTAPAAAAGLYEATEAGFGPNIGLIGPRSGDLAYPSSNAKGCSAFSGTAATQINHKVALLDRGDCNFVDKVKNAQTAGAIAVIVANNADGGLITMGTPAGYDDSGLSIPAVLTSLASGGTLKSALGLGAVAVRISPADRSWSRTIEAARVDTLAPFSSLGPRLGDLALKPDITAPGQTILSAQARSGQYGIAYSGTSMAAPMVTGAMAILRQLHPDWTPEELKALVMNTAEHDLWLAADHEEPRFGGARAGAGRLDVEEATRSDAIVLNADAPERVSLSFGSLEIGAGTTIDRSLMVVNKGTLPRTYSVTYEPIATVEGVAVALPGGSSVAVPAGGQAAMTVRLSANPASMRHSHDPGLVTGAAGGPVRYWMSELSGYVHLVPNDGAALRLPVYAALRPVSSMSAREAVLPLAEPTAQTALHLAGRGLDTGGSAADGTRSLVTPLEWQGGGSALSWVRAVGVTSDFPARSASISDAVIGFGVAVNLGWNTLNQYSVQIQLDTDGNGSADRVLKISDAVSPDPDHSSQSDAFYTVLCPYSGCSGDNACPGGTGACAGTPELPLAGLASDEADSVVFNTDVVVLAARAYDLGLSASAATLRYRVSAGAGTTPFFSYDVAHPAAGFGASSSRVGPVSFLDQNGTNIPVTLDRARLQATGSPGILLLHHHNGDGFRAETVEVATDGCSLACSAVAPAGAAPDSPVSFRATVEAAGCGADPTYSWDFGDGGPGAATAAASHSYATPGTYPWSVTATAGTHACTRTGFITVATPSDHRAIRTLRPPR